MNKSQASMHATSPLAALADPTDHVLNTADSFGFNFGIEPPPQFGTSGNDTMTAFSGGTAAKPSHTYGGDGNDKITGSSGVDVISGGNDDDLIQGVGGHDTLSGGNGKDIVYGGGDFDKLSGGNGDDWVAAAYNSKGAVLDGGIGNDTLVGSFMGATLNGGIGNDFLIARVAFNGATESFYDGGAGWDVMVLDKAMPGSDAFIETTASGDHVLHWISKTGQVQTDHVANIEQFNVGGTLYTWDQLLA
ncbi:calcium-binding protein [Phreatobacter stygius]|uniref:Calcium-binding protein n=1 Tax=Phreatobacter stygius TaxID=1940610 RepID=A0A4D7B7A4_9HYPH|nr:hypothetical protein [Phreatobacter stygius]QCI66783.1 hypothetical protein E8M01_22595 [Phreatobacter stygius]